MPKLTVTIVNVPDISRANEIRLYFRMRAALSCKERTAASYARMPVFRADEVTSVRLEVSNA